MLFRMGHFLVDAYIAHENSFPR